MREGKQSTGLLSIAPMMDWTDRHCRFFLRLITRRALLYTEMVPLGAVLFGERERFLAFDPAERPLALQLGGSEPEGLARAAEIATAYGYDEINLNVGCPSERVQKGRFGACLMAEPELVAASVAAMRRATGLPVTVKCRVGVDARDSYEALAAFVETVAAAGCGTFIVHARKAWLSGLSPKENREIPPLRHDLVARLKEDFPQLRIVLNGGVSSLGEAESHLAVFDGVMLGRAAYRNPWILAEVDRRIYGETARAPTRGEVVAGLAAYLERQAAAGVPVKAVTRHLMGLCNGLPGARRWRRHLSEAAQTPRAGPEVLRDAFALVGQPGALAA